MNLKQLVIATLLAGVAFTGHAGGELSGTADKGNGTYTNPLFYDEFSDPDLIRVGDSFYLAGTPCPPPPAGGNSSPRAW